MSENKTNGGKIGILETIGNNLPTIRNILADISRLVLWVGNYFAFAIVICLVIGSIWGILNAIGATWEIIKVQTPDSTKEGDYQLYPKLIKIAEYYLISFTLFLIAVGIHRIISKVISEKITEIGHLESLMIGLVVITMAVIFLDTIFGVATRVTDGMESVLMFGLAMAVVIVGLALYLKFREKRSEFEEMYIKLKEELKKAIEERREEDKIFTKEEKEEIYKKLKEELKKAIEERREDDVEKIVRLIDSIKKN